MKIKNIRTMVLKGTDPHGMGGTPRPWNVMLVRVDTDEGLFGIGEAPHWQRGYFGVREAIQYIADRLIGKDPFEIQKITHEHFFGAIPPHQPRTLPATLITAGPIVWAMSGIEMAICDLLGKALKTPVYNLLGGKFRDKILVYLDRSAPANKDDLGAWKALAMESKESGFTDIKFDIDHTAPDKTMDVWNRSMDRAQIRKVVERLSAVRDAVGWDMNISVDCHMCYDIPTSITLAQELAPLKLKWFEDPTPIMNHVAVAEVKKKSPIPICVGEMFTVEQFRTYIDHKACDIIHPDILFAGGLHETRKIAELANVNYIPMALHNHSSSVGVLAAAHVAAASPNFIGMEYHFFNAKWIGDLAHRGGKPLFEGTHLVLGDEPGLGFTLNEDICRKYLAEGETYFGNT